jgi:Ca2+-binding RTX toxin-like protein
MTSQQDQIIHRAVMRALLIGCAILLVVGCAGVRSEAPKEQEQGHTEATKEQAHSPGATTSEEAQCEGTRTITIKQKYYPPLVTNDVPGCPNKGGLLPGTDRPDTLEGRDGDDEIRGLGAKDALIGGLGSDVIYGGPGDDFLKGNSDVAHDTSKDVLYGGPGNDQLNDINGGDDVLYGGEGDDAPLIGGKGEDVIYGGDGNDDLDGASVDRQQRDKLYCGEGKDYYVADENDYVDSSCEVKYRPQGRS